MASLLGMLAPVLFAGLSLPVASLFLPWIYTLAFASFALVMQFTFFAQLRQMYATRRSNVHTVAFFHPNCAGKGGGERVLWSMLHCLGNEPSLQASNFCILADDLSGKSEEEILTDAERTFGISLEHVKSRLSFHFLSSCRYSDPGLYPRLTMFRQNIGSLYAAFEVLSDWGTPHVLIDTNGQPFIYPVFRLLAQCQVITYTHYPTISSNMLSRVRDRSVQVNNSANIARSSLFTSLKLAYYYAFAFFYWLCGRCVHFVMANSNWTAGHLKQVWRPASGRMAVVFPPCAVTDFASLAFEPRDPVILSIAQFRPEKHHELQLEAFASVLKWWKSSGYSAQYPSLRPRLFLVGSTRSVADEQRANMLKALAKNYGLVVEERATTTSLIQDGDFDVRFCYNVPHHQLVNEYLAKAVIGLHTMRDEHFGIGVVELMASGVITIAHNSGGPQSDIVCPADRTSIMSPELKDEHTQQPHEFTGILAESSEEYANAMIRILQDYRHEQRLGKYFSTLQHNARHQCARFSEEVFYDSLKKHLIPLLVNSQRSVR